MFPIGARRTQVWTVAEGHLASAFGSGLVPVLATPVLVGFCEECARRLVDPHLPPNQRTVGTSISLEHIAAMPLGMTVSVEAELIEVDGRRLTFRVEARDDVEPVARATHVRFVIDNERFEQRLAEKTRRGGAPRT